MAAEYYIDKYLTFTRKNMVIIICMIESSAQYCHFENCSYKWYHLILSPHS